ncbi:hypothetical protein ACFX1S_003120 [Malus domestica]
MGYSSTQKGYKCYNPATKKCVVSRDVKFEEDCPYFTHKGNTAGQGEELFEMFPFPPVINNRVLEESLVAVTPVVKEIQPDSISDHRILANKGDEESHSDNSQSPTESQWLRRNPPRTRKPLTRLQDYVTYATRVKVSALVSSQHLMSHFSMKLINTLNLEAFKRYLSSHNGIKPWQMIFILYKKIKLGAWFNYHQEKRLLEVV